VRDTPHATKDFGFSPTRNGFLIATGYSSNVAQLIRSGDQRLPHHRKVPARRDVGETTMRVHDRYRLDYDTIAFAVLVIALGIIELLILGI
jgi:hypothetical protein